jgi:hypothetical protein
MQTSVSTSQQLSLMRFSLKLSAQFIIVKLSPLDNENRLRSQHCVPFVARARSRQTCSRIDDRRTERGNNKNALLPWRHSRLAHPRIQSEQQPFKELIHSESLID